MCSHFIQRLLFVAFGLAIACSADAADAAAPLGPREIAAIKTVGALVVEGRGRLPSAGVRQHDADAAVRPRGQARLLAERAARIDAYRRLKDAILSLKLTGGRALGELLSVRAPLAPRDPLLLRGASETRPRWNDEGRVTSVLTLPADQLLRNLRAILDRHRSFAAVGRDRRGRASFDGRARQGIRKPTDGLVEVQIIEIGDRTSGSATSACGVDAIEDLQTVVVVLE
jgi:hypothetical protein